MKQECKFGIGFILVNTIILGFIASLSHFAYEFSGNSIIVGLFNPVNESVWEHLKFMFFPNLLWWIIVFFIYKRKCDINLSKWIIAAAVALFVAPLFVMLLHYTYTGIFGTHSAIFDGVLVFVSYFIALKFAFNIYEQVNLSNVKIVLSIFVIALIFLAFINYTFNPPHIPLFLDTLTRTYGI